MTIVAPVVVKPETVSKSASMKSGIWPEMQKGRIGIIFGTHTHVQTADARILPGGTGYLTDLGMCGPADSILGVETERVIARLKDHLPVRFANPAGETELNGAVFTYDRQAHRCLSVEPVRRSIR